MRLDGNSLLAGSYGWTGKTIEALGLILKSWGESTNLVKTGKREGPKVSRVQGKVFFFRIRLKDQIFGNEIYSHCRTIK